MDFGGSMDQDLTMYLGAIIEYSHQAVFFTTLKFPVLPLFTVHTYLCLSVAFPFSSICGTSVAVFAGVQWIARTRKLTPWLVHRHNRGAKNKCGNLSPVP